MLPYVLWWEHFYHLFLFYLLLGLRQVLGNYPAHTDTSVFRNFFLIPEDLCSILEASFAELII